MKFIDEAALRVKAGDGGAGSRHFRREKYVPFGGPDGGDGGNGGSVYLLGDSNKHTLLDFRFQPLWAAENGGPGGGNGRHGKSGDDLVVRVPPGTQVIDETSGEIVADITRHDERVIIAKGGRGGKGNAFFKSATNQAPDYAQPGEKGDEGSYKLSLKLIADIGLVGLPNAGKSTLISRISSAKPKIADYPFTTLVPNLGVVRAKGGRSFVVADIPGLIPGAHEGKGLGTTFLKHVERTQVIAHLVDLTAIDEEGAPVPPLAAFRMIEEELRYFSPEIAARKRLIVLTKADAIGDRSVLQAIEDSFVEETGTTPLVISSASGEGIELLIEKLASLVTPAAGREEESDDASAATGE